MEFESVEWGQGGTFDVSVLTVLTILIILIILKTKSSNTYSRVDCIVSMLRHYKRSVFGILLNNCSIMKVLFQRKFRRVLLKEETDTQRDGKLGTRKDAVIDTGSDETISIFFY